MLSASDMSRPFLKWCHWGGQVCPFNEASFIYSFPLCIVPFVPGLMKSLSYQKLFIFLICTFSYKSVFSFIFDVKYWLCVCLVFITSFVTKTLFTPLNYFNSFVKTHWLSKYKFLSLWILSSGPVNYVCLFLC